MSTILEALRRAEAERATPPPPMPLVGRVAPTRRPVRSAWWFVGPVLLLLAAAAAWLAAGRQPPEPSPAAPTAPVPAPAPAPLRPAPPVRLEAPGARSLPAPAAAPLPASASAPVAPPRLAELPAALRQQLPALQVGGSMHSPDARLRSLIVNGQLYREGDSVAAGLELVEIRPRSALLRFRAQVFELPY